MGQNYAIVIGINQYDNLGRLKYAKSDAQAMQRWFCESGFEEVYYFAEDAPPISAPTGKPFLAEPSLGKIKNFLDRRFGSVFLQPSDNLWFFFAGHGKRHGEQDYLMLADSNPRQVADTALEIDALSAKFRASGAGNVILFLDACRNDGSRDGLGIGTQMHPGVITFYSCSPGEESFEIDEIASGAFTHALLKGLQAHGEGNCATVERLHNYLKGKVPLLAQKYKSNQQTPSLRLDPETKLDVILLPREARSSDVVKLKNHALVAENQGKFENARELWIQILTNAPGDREAIEAIERLVRSSREQTERTTQSPQAAVPQLIDWQSILEMSDLGNTRSVRLPHPTGRSQTAPVNQYVDSVFRRNSSSGINIPGKVVSSVLVLIGFAWLVNLFGYTKIPVREPVPTYDPLAEMIEKLAVRQWKDADRLTHDILEKDINTPTFQVASVQEFNQIQQTIPQIQQTVQQVPQTVQQVPQTVQQVPSVVGKAKTNLKENSPSKSTDQSPRVQQVEQVPLVLGEVQADPKEDFPIKSTSKVQANGGKKLSQQRIDAAGKIRCETMRVINDSWAKHSQGKLGFSSQLKIYGELGGIPSQELSSEAWNKFGDQVGWRRKGRWITPAEYDFESPNPPAGHFPTRIPGIDEAIFRAAERCRV
jgi:uncharacterized caspase-like protein/uncharacterized protein YoxC